MKRRTASTDSLMPDDQVEVVLRLRLDADDLPVGTLSVADRRPVTFEGWLALMAELRQVLETED